MTIQTTLLMAVTGFFGSLAGVAMTQLLQEGRRRRERVAGRRERLRGDVERVLRAAIRFERWVSPWSPGWRAVSAAAGERAEALAERLDEDAEMAAITMRLEGAARAAQALEELRGRI